MVLESIISNLTDLETINSLCNVHFKSFTFPKWKPLKERNTKHDQTLFYQTVNGYIAIPLPPYVIPVKINNKSHHEKVTYKFFPKIIYIRIPRTIPIWNRLPLDIVNSNNEETFKLALQCIKITFSDAGK